MSASDDKIEPADPEAIRRTWVNEKVDLDNAVNNATSEAYLNWPNEAGFDNLEEHRGPIKLKVKGTIPSWAHGALIRTGPGLSKIENTRKGTIQLSHWFDGLAHTHRFQISPNSQTEETEVFYASRRQCDAFVEHVRNHGFDDMITFAQKADPCVGIFGKFKSSWSASNDNRRTKTLENAAVTVQLGIPRLSIPPQNEGGPGPRQTVWLGTDANFLREIDGRTLEPINFAKQTDLLSSLNGPLSCAHAQRCPTTGDYFNVNIKGGRKATYKVFRVSAATGETDILAELSHADVPLAYIHSFYLSPNFVVLRVPSSHIAAYGSSVLWKKNLLDAMEPFDDRKNCRWFVIDRKHGKGIVAEFNTQAAFFFHTINCFETSVGDIVSPRVRLTMDTIEYQNMNILEALRYDVLMNRDGKARSIWGTEEKARASLPRFVRRSINIPVPQAEEPAMSLGAWVRSKYARLFWKISQETEQVATTIRGFAPRRLSWIRIAPHRHFAQLPAFSDNDTVNIPAPHIGEIPTINPAYHTKPYRYFYSLAMGCRSTFVDTIIKTDIIESETLQWNNPQGHTPGEAIFLARPGGTAEDDGVLLSVVLDGNCRKSYLLCLDATTMMEMGRAEMDFAVGFGFHGVHTPHI